MPRTEYSTYIERFWSRIALPDENDCWIWQGSTNQYGYGHFSYIKENGDTVDVLTHRFAYEQCIGPIPEGKQLDHLCRKRLCSNPFHTEPVTVGENVRRGNGVAGINFRKTHCSRGHLFSEENTYIRPSGGRKCKNCFNDWQRKMREKRARVST